MKVKKYVASSMSEAMKKIREELGSDAVILSSKPVFSHGFIGFFKKRSIEVIAGIEPPSKKPIQKQKQKKLPDKPADAHLASSIKIEKQLKSSDSAQVELVKEIADIKNMMKGLGKTNTFYPLPLQPVSKILIEQEVDPFLHEELLEKLVNKWHENHGTSDAGTVCGWLNAELVAKLSGIPNWGVTFQKKFINFVGPTGVGKTTTLAKAAADSILIHNKKVAFITTDTYRIAAIEQLKKYAEILNVPVEVAYNLEDFKRAAERFAEYDLIFIDTAGRNFRNREYVKDLSRVIDFTTEMETYLVLSLTSKEKDMTDIYQQFSLIEIKQVIFTKADETSTYGTMLNFINQHQLGVAYLTYGQDVPNDIEQASPELIVKTILGEKRYA
ncbi:flagellar biosynthesis protein FlhF [Peribacillus psychrosaccharolyticus]|uniref:Flagellar biosynthesis protein FlhF n=1 Tax=Peribacillus psychrosaccharolyticus TaxID=1407 RepID=A0A974NPK6_PERPY|nr:flagellar biosynthesis protein FlhF [Peribacillus psychrosaccharolyticus]MEC2053822.1 flagellar biosynthesis protein FlhF [Peribacillus psychrosaccharolyticus]MED3742564.1 flagellar biosynthesis protein FlhF [Peribacillus psychrosaccharolyticus]QQT01514.1 flagellar biosynthesis protein FlhF [Peribacillus psychrosaccharolyticus]